MMRKYECPVVNVSPVDVAGVISSGKVPDSDIWGDAKEIIVACEDMEIAIFRRCDNGVELSAIACDHHSHGVHPRYRKLYGELNRMMDVEQAQCTDCGGTGWIQADDPSFKKRIMMAVSIGMFRGVVFGCNGEQHDGLSAIRSFLVSDFQIAGDASKNNGDVE